MLRKTIITLVGMIILVFGATSSVKADFGHSFIIVDLRTDITEVSTAQDYQAWISSNGGPSGNYPNFTTGWLSINLDDEPGLFGHLFTQVGVMTDSGGIYWFVYSEAGVICDRGYYWWHHDQTGQYLGCKGYYNDLVDYGYLHRVEMVTYGGGYWIARVTDTQGNTHDVARILSGIQTIYNAHLDFEETWELPQDPFEIGYYYMRNPGYNNWSTGFSAWPISTLAETNDLRSSPTSICPDHYGAVLNLDGDPRYWFAGTGGITCNAVMFPATSVISLPLIMNQ